MNDFASKFSFKEVIEILIPGGYMAYFILPGSQDNVFFFGFLAIAFGIFVSTIPIGQFILSIFKNLCTTHLYSDFKTKKEKLEKKKKREAKAIIYNYYFRFYDDKSNPDISDLQRNSTELYTGFFNCCCCTAFIALLFCLFLNPGTFLLSGNTDIFLFKGISIHELILSISLLSSVILFFKIRFLYYRQYIAFEKSPLNTELQRELDKL